MIYAGNKSKSYAAGYQDRRYTHSEIINGKVVEFFDCWSHDDEKIPGFPDDRIRRDIKDIDKFFRGNIPE